MFPELNQRSRDILKLVVDAYMETGEPVGSKAIAGRFGSQLSPATIRHVMAELEELGLLHAPHISAGRVPTGAGLRFFVDGILELGDLLGIPTLGRDPREDVGDVGACIENLHEPDFPSEGSDDGGIDVLNVVPLGVRCTPQVGGGPSRTVAIAPTLPVPSSNSRTTLARPSPVASARHGPMENWRR